MIKERNKKGIASTEEGERSGDYSKKGQWVLDRKEE